MGKEFQSLVTRYEKKLKAGFDKTGLDRNKQEPLLEAERLELRVNSFLRSGFGCNPFTILKHSTKSMIRRR